MNVSSKGHWQSAVKRIILPILFKLRLYTQKLVILKIVHQSIHKKITLPELTASSHLFKWLVGILYNTTCSFLLGFRLIFRCYVMLVPGRGNLMLTISSMSQHLSPSLRLGREEIFVTDRFQKRKRPPLYCWRVLRKAPRSLGEYEAYVILSQRLETSMQVLFFMYFYHMI